MKQKKIKIEHVNLSINIFMSWLKQKTKPIHYSSSSQMMIHQVNRELKKIVDYTDKNTLRFVPIQAALDDDVLSVRSVCWIAQSYDKIDDMTLAAKKLASSCLYILRPLVTVEEAKELMLYTKGRAPLNYRIINKVRYHCKSIQNKKYRERVENAVNVFFHSELYLYRKNVVNAYKILADCYEYTVQADALLTQHSRSVIKNMFIRK